MVALLVGCVFAVPIAAGETSWRTVAGTGKSGFGGSTLQSFQSNFAIETPLNSPWGLALDNPNQLLYIADAGNNVIRSVDLVTGLMEVVAGTGRHGDTGDGFSAAEATLNRPTGLVLDQANQILYVSDTNNHRVRKLDLRIGRVYQVEDPATSPFILTSDPATSDRAFVQSKCLVLNASNGTSPLYLGTRFCRGSTGTGYAMFVREIRDRMDFKVEVSYNAVHELRFRYSDRYMDVHPNGDRRLRLIVNGVILTHEMMFYPTGNVQSGRRDVFGWAVYNAPLKAGSNTVILETTGYGGPHVDLLYVLPPRPVIRTVAGVGSPGVSDDLETSWPATGAALHTPLGLALDAVRQRLYIADSDNGRIRRLDISSSKLRTIAGGNTGDAGSRDGTDALKGRLFRPTGLAIDSAARFLYVTDAVEERVRRIDLSSEFLVGGTIITVAGFGAGQAPFDQLVRGPVGLALDEDTGTLLVADSDNGMIRSVLLSSSMCPNLYASRQECGYMAIPPSGCANLSCCWDSQHPDCVSQLAQDGRASVTGFRPLEVITRVDGQLRDPPLSFVQGRSGRCCYPKFRSMSTVEMLDGPQGLVWDPERRAIFISQPKRHKVVRFPLDEGRCLLNMPC